MPLFQLTFIILFFVDQVLRVLAYAQRCSSVCQTYWSLLCSLLRRRQRKETNSQKQWVKMKLEHTTPSKKENKLKLRKSNFFFYRRPFSTPPHVSFGNEFSYTTVSTVTESERSTETMRSASICHLQRQPGVREPRPEVITSQVLGSQTS